MTEIIQTIDGYIEITRQNKECTRIEISTGYHSTFVTLKDDEIQDLIQVLKKYEDN